MTLRERGARWLHEPLVHFLFLGALIFIVDRWRGVEFDPGDRRIIVDERQVQRLATVWSQTWQRSPSPEEMEGLVRDYIKEEIYYREAIRLGLDKDDAVVRRRLQSKMEFLATSEVEALEPDDATLQAWLDKYPTKYSADPVFSFQSVYVNMTEGNEAALVKSRFRNSWPARQSSDHEHGGGGVEEGGCGFE